MGTAPAPADQATAEGRAPTFLFIGGQRCASTWIHRCLDEHPEVFIPPGEVHFFDRHYDRGAAWYFSLFAPQPHHRAWGEKTPAYLSVPEVTERVRALLPDVRLVCCLREPVERAYSLYQMTQYTRSYGSFEDALDTDPRILQMGRYADHLRRWFDAFGRDRILVLLYDELEENEQRFIRRIYAHIGVDAGYRPGWVGKKANAVIFPRLRHTLRRIGAEPVVRAVGRSRTGAWIRRWNHRRGRRAYKPMPEEISNRLCDYYEEPNRDLEALLGVDLSAWRRAE